MPGIRLMIMLTLIFKVAVDRSCGQLMDFSSDHDNDYDYDYGKIEILHYAIEKLSSMKSLRLWFPCDISDILHKIGTDLLVLEELHLSCGFLTKKLIEEVGRNCLRVKYLRFNCLSEAYLFDDIAFAIAQNLPWLLRLELLGTSLTHVGLQAVLDRCLCLEYLHIQYCFFLDVKQNLLCKCAERIREVMLPSDVGGDYESDVDINDCGSSASESYADEQYSLMSESSFEE